MATIEINIYKSGSVWYGARTIDGEYDGCDELDVDMDADAADAIACAQQMPLAVSGERIVRRVEDVAQGS